MELVLYSIYFKLIFKYKSDAQISGPNDYRLL